MTPAILIEWIAYGLLEDWFPRETEDANKMTPEQSQAFMEARYANG